MARSSDKVGKQREQCEIGGNKSRQSLNFRSELPGNRTIGLGLISAEVAGTDRGSKMTPQRGVLAANSFHHRADILADQPARAFRATRSRARTTAKSRGSGEFLTDHLDLGAQVLRAPQVIHSFRFVQLGLKIAQPGAVFGTGSTIKGWSRGIDLANGFQKIGRA